ncbi:MAG: hypothetical protein R3321_06855 [Nitrososphaeraceae archaeon]|nr:hypothetical protein [Nitrososphaeraceae archaeon]
MKPIETKKQFYKLFHKGYFGNTSPYWSTYEEYYNSGYNKPIAIRTRKAGGKCEYFVERKNVKERLKYFTDEVQFSAQCPEEDKLLQGEVQLTNRGMYLFGSTNLQLPMRDALKNDSFHIFGLKAHLYVKNAMCPNSWEWLNELFTLYPDHIIEFTTLRYSWGTDPGFNTLFWEVRKY